VEIYFSYNKIPCQTEKVITLGNFDGFHRGHQKIVSRTVASATDLGLSSLIMTFHPHPRQLFSGDLAILTPLERKAKLLSTDVDFLLVQPFTKSFAAMDPRKFIEEILIKSLRCRKVVVGYDYSFGAAGAGNTQLLQEVCGEQGLECEIIDPVWGDDEIISSTVVRNYLSQGNVQTAAKYMGRPYAIAGRVEAGAGRGKKLGFPTANIYPPPAVALPAFGVYLVKAVFQGQAHWGLANVGRHPTFPSHRPSLEVFVLDFQGDLYGEMMEIYFYQRIRPEQKFSHAKALQEQVGLDLQHAHALLETDNVLKLQRI